MIQISSPLIFGILNITEDSFSDGGKFLSAENALGRADELTGTGAHVIDIGPASSNPASERVSSEIQIERLSPVFSYLQSKNIPVSADVCDPEVQKWAIDHNADYINDIDGFKNPEILERLSHKKTRLIVMHSLQRSGKADKRPGNPETIIESIRSFFSSKLSLLNKYNIEPERIILDPGMGFFLGADPVNSLITLKYLKSFKKEFPYPFLISVSRKSFLGEITGRAVNDRDYATAAAEIYSIFIQGADMIRTHNPRAISDSVKTWNALISLK
jgi:dihydropteroate synthase